MAESSAPAVPHSDSSTPALAPHPPIAGAYMTPESKRGFLDSIFDDTAADYDRVERWLSLGSGRWYRREALKRAGLKAGMRVADVAVGTGLVAGEALTIVGPTGRVTGIDPSAQMMRRASDRLGIETVAGTAEALPFPDASFDFLSMGYALRHVGDLNAAFREFHRVLKPEARSGGGRVCILEITRPRTPAGRLFLRSYLAVASRMLGLVARLSRRTPELWAYYWETIDACVPGDRIVTAMRDAGFVDVERGVVLGIFSEYTAARG